MYLTCLMICRILRANRIIANDIQSNYLKGGIFFSFFFFRWTVQVATMFCIFCEKNKKKWIYAGRMGERKRMRQRDFCFHQQFELTLCVIHLLCMSSFDHKITGFFVNMRWTQPFPIRCFAQAIANHYSSDEQCI